MSVLIFGYGSLVNAATHAHAVHPARAIGWRRVWREVAGRPHAILSVHPAPGAPLEGAIMAIPDDALGALDAREALYVRQDVRVIDHHTGSELAAQVYVVSPHTDRATRPILQSYLDVVLAGFADTYGDHGPADFIATTDGWHLPLKEDRPDPLYPRHQPMSPERAALHDKLHKKHST